MRELLVLVGLWVVGAWAEAEAATPAPYSTYYIYYMCQDQSTCGAPPQTSPRFTTIGAACQWADSLSSYTYSHYTFPWGVCCPAYCRANNYDSTVYADVAQGNQCPAGTTLSGGSCNCNNGGNWDDATQSCQSACPPYLTMEGESCVCPIAGQIDTGRECVCLGGKVLVDGVCQCAPGWSWDGSLLQCVINSFEECAEGQAWDPVMRACVVDRECPEGFAWNVELGCMPVERCQVGWTPGGSLPCQPEQPANCEGGSWGSVNGESVCIPADDSNCVWVNGRYLCQDWASDDEKRCVVGANGQRVCLEEIPADTPIPTDPRECPTGCVCDPRNGRMVCTSGSQSESTTETTRETLPDGRTVETQTRRDGSGVVTGTTVIERDAEGHETSRKVTDGGGHGEGSESSVTATACGEFVCRGDAIQCFLARQAHEAACVRQGPTEATVEGVAAHYGDSAKLSRTETDLSDFGPFAEGPLGGASDATCPAPMSVSAFGSSVDVGFEGACGLAELVRPLVLSFGGLAGIRFMFGR